MWRKDSEVVGLKASEVLERAGFWSDLASKKLSRVVKEYEKELQNTCLECLYKKTASMGPAYGSSISLFSRNSVYMERFLKELNEQDDFTGVIEALSWTCEPEDRERCTTSCTSCKDSKIASETIKISQELFRAGLVNYFAASIQEYCSLDAVAEGLEVLVTAPAS